jgi:hypothetical protein
VAGVSCAGAPTRRRRTLGRRAQVVEGIGASLTDFTYAQGRSSQRSRARHGLRGRIDSVTDRRPSSLGIMSGPPQLRAPYTRNRLLDAPDRSAHLSRDHGVSRPLRGWYDLLAPLDGRLSATQHRFAFSPNKRRRRAYRLPRATGWRSSNSNHVARRAVALRGSLLSRSTHLNASPRARAYARLLRRSRTRPSRRACRALVQASGEAAESRFAARVILG